MTSDEFRLLAISKVLDEIGGIDLHARACAYGNGNEPKDSHYLAAVREGLDQIVREEFGEVQPSDVSRDSILEEAAKVCEAKFQDHYDHSQRKGGAQECADAIRSLKRQSNSERQP